MTNWLKWFDAALANYHGSKPAAVFQDSYEYRTDWSPDFFAQFEKLRGYKLQTELPALFSGAGILPASSDGAHGVTRPTEDEIARVKYDYRRTISEIMAQQSEPAWIDWAHKNGFSTIYQAHGTPANWLDLYGDADMPETEMFHNDRSILISKFASSAAHTQGRQFTGAETGTWLKEHFTETLADLKYLADDMFLSGVNRIFYHGACYSPDVETGTFSPLLQKTIGEGGGWEGGEGQKLPWPGWLFYASTEMNPRNPIWRDVPALNAYIARCQAVLQSGQPDNDVLLYWPVADFWSQPDGLVQPMAVGKTEWFENQPIGKTAHELWNKGYAFDYVSDAQLLKAKVRKWKNPNARRQISSHRRARMQIHADGNFQAIARVGDKVEQRSFLKCNYQQISPVLEILQKRERDDFKTGCECQNPELKLIRRHQYRIFGKLVSTLAHGSWKASLCCMLGDPARHWRFGLSFIRRSFDGGWNYFIANRDRNEFDGWISLVTSRQDLLSFSIR